MDRIKERMANLRAEADAATERAEQAEAKVKKLEQELLTKEQENTSLGHQKAFLEAENEKLDQKLKEAKDAGDAGASSRATAEDLARKVQLLEDELDAAEKNVKETVEKLRQVDVKAEHFERQVQKLEQERDAMEKKYDDQVEKAKQTQKELDELVSSMGDV
ncbi:hypothetical protein FRC10_007345 [Ceratobasidium sp. 414]|nr:hypothetical protein FRC10_007345 [Ceratobasidium sp. 414]